MRLRLGTRKACERQSAVRRREDWRGLRLKAWQDLVPEVTEQLKILMQHRHRHSSWVRHDVAEGGADPEELSRTKHPRALQLQRLRTPGQMRQRSRPRVPLVTGTGGLPICHRLHRRHWGVHPRLKKHEKNKKNHRDKAGCRKCALLKHHVPNTCWLFAICCLLFAVCYLLCLMRILI